MVVWKLDRIGRSVKQLVSFVENLSDNDINFISIKDGIDTSTSTGRFFFHIERTQAGFAAARLKGRNGGRPRKMTDRGSVPKSQNMLGLILQAKIAFLYLDKINRIIKLEILLFIRLSISFEEFKITYVFLNSILENLKIRQII